MSPLPCIPINATSAKKTVFLALRKTPVSSVSLPTCMKTNASKTVQLFIMHHQVLDAKSVSLHAPSASISTAV